MPLYVLEYIFKKKPLADWSRLTEYNTFPNMKAEKH